MTKLGREFFAQSVHDVAPELIGATLLVDGVGGVIVELEAYDHEDPAAHGYRGRTERNKTMFGPPGHAYVYRSYGVHWCLNFVCEPEGVANAVLIRALEPTHGLAAMRLRRGLEDERRLCAGPGRLCQGLAVRREQDGTDLVEGGDLRLERGRPAPDVEIASGPRVGITVAREHPWRFLVRGSRYLSRGPVRLPGPADPR